ncbi:helix-turn-helix domain-containing protein [Patescibacteria group bacterium]|nr:helix-turn-helix domain-containing protein [Patescibacteria group bacterium]MBU1778265.1 helix-turn-helix domain-containing protein [Patescibacteria group bacterium]
MTQIVKVGHFYLATLGHYHVAATKEKEIGDKIKVLRTKQGLTQDALARRCDIPYTTLTKIESNVITKPSIQTVTKIAAGLGISIDELIK